MDGVRLVKKGHRVEIEPAPESPLEREVKLFWQGAICWDRLSTAGRFLVQSRLESHLASERSRKPTVEDIFGKKA